MKRKSFMSYKPTCTLPCYISMHVVDSIILCSSEYGALFLSDESGLTVRSEMR